MRATPMRIYTKRDGEQSGPFTIEKVVAKILDGSLHSTDLAWHEGEDGWKPISQCGFITRSLPPPLPPPAAPAAKQEPIVIQVQHLVAPTPTAAPTNQHPPPDRPRRPLPLSKLALSILLVTVLLALCPPLVAVVTSVLLLVFIWREGASRVKPATHMIQGPGLFETEVVGESNYQPALEFVCGGRTPHSAEHYCEAALCLEDQNTFDNQAVRIDINGRTVGYLSRRTAREYRQRLVEAGHPRLDGRCKAVVRGGRISKSGELSYFGVWLDLPNVD